MGSISACLPAAVAWDVLLAFLENGNTSPLFQPLAQLPTLLQAILGSNQPGADRIDDVSIYTLMGLFFIFSYEISLPARIICAIKPLYSSL